LDDYPTAYQLINIQLRESGQKTDTYSDLFQIPMLLS